MGCPSSVIVNVEYLFNNNDILTDGSYSNINALRCINRPEV